MAAQTPYEILQFLWNTVQKTPTPFPQPVGSLPMTPLALPASNAGTASYGTGQGFQGSTPSRISPPPLGGNALDYMSYGVTAPLQAMGLMAPYSTGPYTSAGSRGRVEEMIPTSPSKPAPPGLQTVSASGDVSTGTRPSVPTGPLGTVTPPGYKPGDNYGAPPSILPAVQTSIGGTTQTAFVSDGNIQMPDGSVIPAGRLVIQSPEGAYSPLYVANPLTKEAFFPTSTMTSEQAAFQTNLDNMAAQSTVSVDEHMTSLGYTNVGGVWVYQGQSAPAQTGSWWGANTMFGGGGLKGGGQTFQTEQAYQTWARRSGSKPEDKIKRKVGGGAFGSTGASSNIGTG